MAVQTVDLLPVLMIEHVWISKTVCCGMLGWDDALLVAAVMRNVSCWKVVCANDDGDRCMKDGCRGTCTHVIEGFGRN